MSWLTREEGNNPREMFRKYLKEDGINMVPGAHDALAAILAKNVGFKILYLSGGAFSATLGIPDVGLVTLTELTNRTRELYRATGLPILVDIDTGFGSTLSVVRTIKELEEAGAAAVQIEDQDLPKKCGHLNGKKLVSTEEMVQKIQACRKASPSMVIVARTDAVAVEGVDAAIARAKEYVKAGADVIFPEALRTEKEFKHFAASIEIPLLANMTEYGQTPYYTAEEFEKFGYKLVIYPVTSLRVAAHAIESVYETIYTTGSQQSKLEEMQTRSDLYDTIQYYAYEDLDNTIARTVLKK